VNVKWSRSVRRARADADTVDKRIIWAILAASRGTPSERDMEGMRPLTSLLAARFLGVHPVFLEAREAGGGDVAAEMCLAIQGGAEH